MSLSERAVSRPVTTAMAFIAVVVIGSVSLSRLSIDLLPELDFPSITIFTSYEGVGPVEIETLITRPIEEAVSTVQGLEQVESFSAEGRSRVSLRFAWGTPLDTALNDVRAVVERLRDTLPEEAETPIVFKFDLSSFPIMFLTLSGELEPWRLRLLAEDVIKYRLERLEGVASAEVRGGLSREIHVELDGGQLSALGIGAAQVIDALRRENVNVPAGDVLDQGNEVIVRTLGEYRDLNQMGAVVVAMVKGRPIRVRDLARLTDGLEEPVNVVNVNGQPGIRIAISKLAGANTVDVADRIRAEVASINSELPEIELMARFDTSEYIRDSINNVQQGVLIGAALALVVLLLFLRSLRATAIVGIAIPIAIVGTFALMDLGDFTLNMVTFGGLALGTGMLVDNSIVILENIERHRRAGLPPKEASILGSREVSTAIVASTITTLCIFVPVIFVEGFAGIFFSQMAYVVSFALVCSLGVALTLVPVMASTRFGIRSVGVGEVAEGRLAAALGRAFTAVEEGYGRLLTGALRWPKLVIVLSLALLGAAVAMARFVGVELVPTGDESEVRITAELPIGTPLEETTRVMAEIDRLVDEQVPEANGTMWVAGPGGFWSDSGGNSASVRIGLVDPDERTRSSEEVAKSLRPALAAIPGLKARASAGQGFFLFKMLRGGEDRLQVNVRGYDLAKGSKLGNRVVELTKRVKGVVEVDTDRRDGSREAVVEVDADRAADLGLSVGKVAQAVSTYVLGTAATYFREGGDEFKVLVRLREEDRERAGQLEALPIITPDGRRVQLGDVARIVRREGPISIRRLDQQRIVTVSGGLDARDLGSVVADLQPRLDELRGRGQEAGLSEVPEGFTVTIGGEFEEQQETFTQLAIGFLLALALVYMVMASLFESLLHPLIMMAAVPFSAIGVVTILVATGTTFNVYSFLGVIVLIGIVVNNAIVLLDYTNLLRREKGLSPLDAMIEAGRRRLRPILMTTLTTVLALIPVSLGLQEGSEMQAPLARVVVGGLLSSTLVTLLLIPTLYVGAESLRARWRARGEGS